MVWAVRLLQLCSQLSQCCASLPAISHCNTLKAPWKHKTGSEYFHRKNREFYFPRLWLCLKSQGIPQISRLFVLLQSKFILLTPSFGKTQKQILVKAAFITINKSRPEQTGLPWFPLFSIQISILSARCFIFPKNEFKHSANEWKACLHL